MEKNNSKIMEIYNFLYNLYGSQGWWPIREDVSNEETKRLEIILGAILTQNTSWKNVEKAIESLYRNEIMDKQKLLDISERDLANVIKSSGYFNQKARKIKKFLEYKGEITRDNLLSIWGLGPETVDSILLYAYGREEFVVDAYTKRMFSCYGIIKGDESYDEIKDIFEKEIKGSGKKNIVEIYNEYHALIVKHCKKCYSKKPYKGDPVLELLE